MGLFCLFDLRERKKKSFFLIFSSMMSSNTVSSSTRVAGLADSAAPRRNPKKPKCNFFSKDLIFKGFFVCLFVCLWSFVSIHEYPLANLLSFHMGFAWNTIIP